MTGRAPGEGALDSTLTDKIDLSSHFSEHYFSLLATDK